ncbi:uncharacterized protein F4822DRAFT_348531 [Hypoxylon trugodes]|uniref:uncharacterized protein n=1 Tax=Hypoxylon trugodes TaxID=326681 RepID=UPI00218D5FEF|nr:uncharacterized protein F4822DRAFT_348531 [Hypoxylon trugodes]KAI1385590.1 hypothetical protein F4822DRAFT_348531 [Hypoxylon trugodes]
MSSKDPSFSSNNPFRRKLGSPSVSTEKPALAPTSSHDKSFNAAPRPPFTTFRSVVSDDGRRNVQERADAGEAASLQPKPKKIVKKVRVQSPPPSSPEDSTPTTRFPPIDDDEEDEDEDDDDDDIDGGDSSDSRDYEEHFEPIKKGSIATQYRDRDSLETAQVGPPANPFSKTLQDLERTGQGQDENAPPAGVTAKRGLDVDSFKKLLLTGYASIPGPSLASTSKPGGDSGGSAHPQAHLLDGASNTDASSVSRQSIFDAILQQDTPRTSHEISEPEDPEERRGILPTSPLSSLPSASARKKPPPPSSRHGKLIKIELGADAETRAAKDSSPPVSVSNISLPPIAPPRKSNSHSATLSQASHLATDVNKPLPSTPFRPSVEEAVDSPFDREAIGKVPEPFADLQTNPRPPTPPVATRSRSVSNGSTQPRKPAAPPPRRHGRSDSRGPPVNTANTDEDTPPRSSLESTRSQTSSLRANVPANTNINVPAPPPPRRPNHARQGSSYTSPNLTAFPSVPLTSPGIGEAERSPSAAGASILGDGEQPRNVLGLATFTTSKDGVPKLSPPPPPPTRQLSTRRPASVRSMDSGSGPSTARKVSREKEGGVAPPPPPPPPRQRGSSRASVETPAPTMEGAKPSGETRKEGVASPQSPSGTANEKQGQEILADIDALQKEVDALMGKYEKSTTS